MRSPDLEASGRFIYREDVAGFLDGSALEEPVWHSTDTAHVESFRQDGVKIWTGSGVCDGFYCSQGEPWKGPLGRHRGNWVDFEVAMRIDRGLRCKGSAYILSALGPATSMTSAATRQLLLDRGFDGVICDNGTVIGLVEEQIKLVYD